MKDHFTQIYKNNFWHGKESRSGHGSDAENTVVLKTKLIEFLNIARINKIIDLACGDFNWMRDVITSTPWVDYVGVDIVEDAIIDNIKKYGSDRISFYEDNIINGFLEHAGMAICRDCMVHLSFSDNKLLIQNIKNHKIPLLMATTFTNDDRINRDIQTGAWRAINLEKPPFNFGKPKYIICEEYKKEGGLWTDKCLGLWDTSKLEVVF